MHMTTPVVYDEQPHKDVNDETTSQSHRTLQSHRPTTNDYDEQRNEGGGDQTTNTITAKTIHKIPTHLHDSFQILNSLKNKRNKHKTTLEKLTIHKNDNTLPNGLKHITNCNILLEEDLQRRWMKASKDAAKVN